MLRYIDTHIREKLNVEKLAARAGFSPDLSSGQRIVDIAVDYGFETHSGFSKAFRRYFGCSPEVYRIHAAFDVPKLPILSRDKQYVPGGIVMEPKMLKKEAVKIAGFALNTRTKDGENKKAIPKFWTDYLSDGRMEKLHGESFLKSNAEYGVCFMENPENGEFTYVIGVEVKEGHEIPAGYHVCTIPKALYAVFSTPPADEKNFSPAIQGTWDFIHSEWFPNSGYEFDGNGVDFELYDERCMGKTGKICDIYIPVVKRRLEN